MKKFLMVTLFCSLLQPSFAAYEEMYNMKAPETITHEKSIVEKKYTDGVANSLLVLEAKKQVIQESFSEALGHYHKIGAQVVAHTNKGGLEVITFRVSKGDYIVHLVKSSDSLRQIMLKPPSKNYRNFKNYLEANNLSPTALWVIINSQELEAHFEDLKEEFNAYF